MKKKTKSMSPKQILAYIAFIIAVVWTLKFVFELSSSGVKQITNSGSKQVTSSSETKNETETPANKITITCSFMNGHAIIQGDMINVPKGFKGTHDIAIVLDLTNKEIYKFDELSGFLYAKNTIFSDTRIYWRWIMDDNSSTYTYTDYYLSRTTGELKVLFESKISKYGSTAYTYNCNKASQKF